MKRKTTTYQNLWDEATTELTEEKRVAVYKHTPCASVSGVGAWRGSVDYATLYLQ